MKSLSAASRLPPELLHEILSHLPPPGYATSPLRHSILLSCCLVNKNWFLVSQPLLYKSIVLPTPASARLFLSQALDSTSTTTAPKADWVKAVRFGTPNVEGRKEVALTNFWPANGKESMEGVLERCKEVEALWIACCAGLELGALAGVPKLKHLYLSESRTTFHAHSSSSPSDRLHLPHLETLYLKSLIFPTSHFTNFLSPSILPSLHTLDFLSVHEARSRPPAGAGGAFEAIAGQLKSLSVGNYAGDSLRLEALSRCTGLERLDIPVAMFGDGVGGGGGSKFYDVADSLSGQVPDSVKFLRIRGPASRRGATVQAREDIEEDVGEQTLSALRSFTQVGKEGHARLEFVVVPSVKVVEVAQEERWPFKVELDKFEWQKDAGFHLDHEGFRKACQQFKS